MNKPQPNHEDAESEAHLGQIRRSLRVLMSLMESTPMAEGERIAWRELVLAAQHLEPEDLTARSRRVRRTIRKRKEIALALTWAKHYERER